MQHGDVELGRDADDNALEKVTDTTNALAVAADGACRSEVLEIRTSWWGHSDSALWRLLAMLRASGKN